MALDQPRHGPYARVRAGLSRVKHALRRGSLAMRGKWIPFLLPFWDSEELGLGPSAHQPLDPEPRARAERALLEALGVDGVAVATSSGRTALELGLRALHAAAPDRDRVVMPSYTCRGVLDPVLRAGLTPIFADVGADLNVTAQTLAPHLDRRTLAVIVVHLGGKRVGDFPTISAMAEDLGAVVIDDLCQALGGFLADPEWRVTAPMSIYSFGLGKNLMATAGGMLVARGFRDHVQREQDLLTDESPECPARRLAIMRRWRGTWYRVFFPSMDLPATALAEAYGYHRMSALDARLVCAQIAKLETIVGRRTRNATILAERIAGMEGLEIPGLSGPNVWTKFPVIAPSAQAAVSIRDRLQRAGVETEAMYTPLHLRDCGREYATQPLPISESVYPRVFNVPVRPSLDEREMAYVADTLAQAVRLTGAKGPST